MSANVGRAGSRDKRSGSIDSSHVVVQKHPNRRRIEIVELPAACAPDKGYHGNQDHEQGQWQHQIYDAHGRPPFEVMGNVRPNHEPSTTVIDATGIRMDAINGVRIPDMANDAPIML